VLSIASQGFSGWQSETLYFTAGGSGTSAVTQLLSFLALSPNSGHPPMLLLDAVSIAEAPEPASLALMLIGLTGLGLLRRKQEPRPPVRLRCRAASGDLAVGRH
jgi:hypothetical protein